MQSDVDVVYFIEHAARELDVACAVKSLLARQSIRMEICSIITGLDETLTRWQPSVVALPYGTSVKDWNLEPIVAKWGNARYINLSFEQVLGKTQKAFKAPKDQFARQHLVYSAWGDFFVDYLQAYAVPPENIAVVGNPALALYTLPYRNYYSKSRAELASHFGLSRERRWVFVPENYGWAFFKDNNVRDRIRRGFDPQDAFRYRDFALASLHEAAIWWREASKLEGIELIVRPRPAIPTEKFRTVVQEFAGEIPKHLHIIKHGSVREWTLASDLVFSSYSTTLLDAALADKPVYMLTPYRIPAFLYAEWYDLTAKVNNLDEFTKAMQSDPLDSNWIELQGWVKQQMMSKGDAISNLADMIQAVVQNKLDIEPPRHVAAELHKPSLERFWRKIRKIGWYIWQTVLSIMGNKDSEIDWSGHEQDHISAEDIVQRGTRWTEILGLTMAKVSVIIPTYNRATYICEAIASVLVQTYQDYEIIVVDDGSTDDTQKALQSWIEDGIIRYVYQKNQGESSARNHGIRLAQAEYIAFLDLDDLLLPTKFEKQIEYLDAHPEEAFVQSWYAKFDDQGNDLGYRDTSKICGNVYPDILLDWSVLLAVPSVVVRTEIIDEVGGFDEAIHWGPDLDLWRRITQKYPIGVIPEVLCKIRVHPGNISGDKVSAAASFAVYLQKAFDDDPSLGEGFQRKAMAKMYANVAHNILAAGDDTQMDYVRRFSFKALRFWPLQTSAVVATQISGGWRTSLMKPAILFLGTQMAIGGAQRMMLLQADWFHQQGYQMSAVFIYDKENLQDKWQSENDYSITHLNGWKFGASPITNSARLLRSFWRLWKILRENDIAVIETFTPHSDLWGLPVAWLARVPVRVGCFQGVIQTMPDWQAWIHARLINTPVASKLVCVSDQMSELALEMRINQDKVVTIPNAIDIPDLEIESDLRAQRDHLRNELAVPNEGVLAITSARLDTEKGHRYLLQAIPDILRAHSDTVFALCGDGYLRADLEKQAVDLGIQENVRFLGIRYDVPALLRAADIYILPSLAEGLSLAMLEAMVARLPVVLTRVQGSIQVIKSGENGLLVPPEDSKALSDALCLLISQPENWRSLGESARQTVLDSYTIDQISRQYEKLFFTDQGIDLK